MHMNFNYHYNYLQATDGDFWQIANPHQLRQNKVAFNILYLICHVWKAMCCILPTTSIAMLNSNSVHC